jgi:hypothetical protein
VTRLRRALTALTCLTRGHHPGPLEPDRVTYADGTGQPIRLARCVRCGVPVAWARALPGVPGPRARE